eukprot:GHVR01091481.1.p1 GENE.GHVR01091481.1~~GHVR01091481.1.p1  ORF type:complete len:138 (+),score=8.74 GHVR01091481.1:192-605(+)
MTPHLPASVSESVPRNLSASVPAAPSTVKTSGVKLAAAATYLDFFADSFSLSTQDGVRFRYDRASVSVTHISNNASVCLCHTPLTRRSAMSVLPVSELSAMFFWFFSHLGVRHLAQFPYGVPYFVVSLCHQSPPTTV